MLTHQKLFTVPEGEMREEIRRRKQVRHTREKQEQIIRKIAEEEGLHLEYCGINVPNNTLNQDKAEEDLEEIMLKNNRQYQDMIECGNKIATVMSKGDVCEGSLTREHKHALDLYRK